MSYAKRMEQKTTGGKIKPRKTDENLMRKKSQKVKNNFYADNQVEQMRTMLADYWAENIDGDTIADILLMGNKGYEKTNKEVLTEEFETVFGENYFSRD